MSTPVCPICDAPEVLVHADHYECLTCGHEWPKETPADEPSAGRVVKDAMGTSSRTAISSR